MEEEKKEEKKQTKTGFFKRVWYSITKIEKYPDITLGELREKFELNLSIPALSKKLKKLGFTYKKRLYTQMLKKD